MSVARARKTDPFSSHAAAAQLEFLGLANIQRERVLATLVRHPGKTSAELAALDGEDYRIVRHMYGRRLPELVEDHLACRGGIRLCETTGRPCITWYPITPTPGDAGKGIEQ